MKRIIKNGLIIDPQSGEETRQDITLIGDSIAGIGTANEEHCDDIIDATGLWVMPGLIDISAHLREPGETHKATIASEAKAAAASGITTLICPPNTNPPLETPADLELIRRLAIIAGYSRVLGAGALTAGLHGQHLTEMAALKESGCVGVSNARQPLASPLILRRAMEYAASQNLTVFLNPIDHALANQGCAHEGAVASRLGLPPIAEAAETAALGMQLELVRQTGATTHFCRISSARGVKLIERAKREGLAVTADAAIHQLFLTEMDVSDFNTLCKTDPPLRSQRDREALRAAVANGTIDVLCSDHQPHDEDAKLAPFPEAESGISGLETLLPLTLRLAEENVLTKKQALACLTHKPAHLLGLQCGSIKVGNKADLCLFDPEQHWEVNQQDWISEGLNTPFMGWGFKGKVVHTIMDGNSIFHA